MKSSIDATASAAECKARGEISPLDGSMKRECGKQELLDREQSACADPFKKTEWLRVAND